MHRFIAIFLFAISTCLSLRASIPDDRVKLPDFAYPQDVIKTATELIKSRLADERVLGALELWNAERLVDYGSLAKSIKRLDSLANSDSDPAVKALLKLMGAEIGRNIRWNRSIVNNYMDNQGTFDEQRIALDSIITSMLKEAMAIAPPTPLTEFRNSMDWNKIGLSILPTVRDFVAWYTVQINPKLLDEVLKSVDKDSPVAYSLTQEYKNQSKATSKYQYFLDRLNIRANDYALYLFIKGMAERSLLTDKKVREELEFLETVKPAVKDSWLEKTVDQRIELLHTPFFTAEYKNESQLGEKLKVKITGYNIDELTLSLYSFTTEDKAQKSISTDISLLKSYPMSERILKFENSPFGSVQTDSVSLTPGYYVLRVTGKDFSEKHELKALIKVEPWTFVRLTAENGNQWIQVLDIATGAPIAGAPAVIRQSSMVTNTDLVTDAKGCIKLPDYKQWYEIGFRDKDTGNIFFYDRSIRTGGNRAQNDNDNILKWDITTDRSVYRPGEKVCIVATASNGKTTVKDQALVAKIYLPKPKGSNKNDDNSFIELSFNPSDEFGRTTAEFIIPDNTELGYAQIQTLIGNHYSLNRSFKIAEFKLNDLAIKNYSAELTMDSVILRGRTVNEAGIGISDVTISGTASYNIYAIKNVFHIDPSAVDVTSDKDGNFIISVPRYYSRNMMEWIYKYAKKEDINEEYLHSSDIESDPRNFNVNFSLVAMAPNGRSVKERYNVNMEYPNSIDCRMSQSLINKSKGFNFEFAINGYDCPEQASWSIRKKEDGNTAITGIAKPGTVNITPSMLKKLTPGEYSLTLSLSDKSADNSVSDFSIYDLKDDYVPTNNPFIIIDKGTENGSYSHYLIGNKSEALIGVKNDDTYVWVSYRKSADESKIGLKDLTCYKLNRGWHNIPIVINKLPKDYTSVDVTFYSGSSRESIYLTTIKDYVKAPDTLRLLCESFRDKLVPGSEETWQLVTRLNDKPVKAAVFLNMINSKLLKFGKPSLPWFNRIEKNLKTYFDTYSSRSIYNKFSRTFNSYIKPQFTLPFVILPRWRDLFDVVSSVNRSYDSFAETGSDVLSSNIQTTLKGKVAGVMVSSASDAPMTLAKEAIRKEVAEDEAESPILNNESTNSGLNTVEVREPKVYTALWEPMLTTGKDGRVDVSFIVPGETTGWELFAEAWTTDLLSARLTHSFTAVKPLVVAPNPPRFVRVGDSVNLVSAITNATDSVMDVSVWVTVKGDSISLADAQSDFTLAAGETRFVNTPVSVDVTGGQLVYTVRASNGITGDGERNAIPVLASTALVTESRNFYLNPGQAEFSMSLPLPEGTDFSSELHFTANPMWSVVEALPKAIEPWCKAASALAMSIYTSNTALDLNRRFPQAKDVIDIANARKVARQSLAGLRELQTNDGGFKWGVWADGPDRHSTLAVLDWLASEKERPEIAALINPALEYVDKTAVGKDGKVDTDFLYTVVRSFYGMPADQNGSRVVNATVTDMLRNWKKYSIDQKALTVIALKNYGYDKVAKTILGSLSQFGRMTDDRGFEFPNMPTILAYTHTLEAFASADPGSDIARRIVQHLLYIRQGMDWGSSAFTSYAVRSIMTAASSWVTKASPVAVSVDGVTVPTDADGLAGVVNTPVSGRRVTVSRTEPSTPAYGAVVSRFVAPLSDIAPFSDGEVTVTKTIVRVRPDGSQELLGQNVAVTPGERLTVILKVTAKRPLSNLVVTDNRPAAFEPVLQVPRMVWNRTGSPFYLENRDAMTNIYISYMPAGAAEYSYEVTVNNTGAFTTGLATVTSAIAPEITAHSGSTPFSLSNAK